MMKCRIATIAPAAPAAIEKRPTRIVPEQGWISGRAEVTRVHRDSLAVDLVLALENECGDGDDLRVNARPVSGQARAMAEQIRLLQVRAPCHREVLVSVELAAAEPLLRCSCDRCAPNAIRCFGADLLGLTEVTVDGHRTLSEFDKAVADLSAWLIDEPDAPWLPRTTS